VAIAVLGGGVLVLVGAPLIRVWTRGAVGARVDVLLALAIWTCLSVWGQAVAAFLNGVGKIRVQAATAVFMSAAAYLLKLLLVRPLGPGGVVWATVIAYSIFTYLPLLWILRRILRPSEASASP
jgi:O-antigen/teichoic acid export membrane protein